MYRNTEGTINFQPRVHKFDILFTPDPSATVANPSPPNLLFTYKESIKFYGPDGTPTTGLDADGSGYLSYPGFPDLPVTTIQGDGFGGPGKGGKAIPIDAEGIVLNPDGGFWISDEYGPYVYRFDATGRMIGAIRPPQAIIPMRNGTDSFSADSPTYSETLLGEANDVIPADNPTGRDNNHGFEGLTVTGDGKTLYVLLQAAANQEGGLSKQTERYARFLKYDSKPNSLLFCCVLCYKLRAWVLSHFYFYFLLFYLLRQLQTALSSQHVLGVYSTNLFGSYYSILSPLFEGVCRPPPILQRSYRQAIEEPESGCTI